MAKNPIIYVDSRALAGVSLMMASNSSNNNSFGKEIEEINIHLVSFEVGFIRRSAALTGDIHFYIVSKDRSFSQGLGKKCLRSSY